MYLFPALTCEPVIGSLEAFTKGILRVFEAVLTEPETEINTGGFTYCYSFYFRYY